MSSNSVPLQPPMTRDAAGTLLGQTMGLVAVTAGLFAVGAYLGHNLPYQFWALIGLILFGIVAIFVQIPSGALIYTVLGLVIFAGLTAFDFQRLRRSQDMRTALLLAASIFLDILNVFLLLLSLFGGRED
jgi:FtsH-binding integral membrane protein